MDTFIYRVADTDKDKLAPFHLMRKEGLLPWAMPAFIDTDASAWLDITSHGVVLLCESMAGALLGCGHFTRFRGHVWEFDFTAFRAGFAVAPAMARGGFQWMFENYGATAIIGICPKPNRHAWKLARACGFSVFGDIPGACFFARKKKCVPGVLVLATPESVKEACIMGFGGGGRGYEAPAPTPKAQTTKPVTAAATEARKMQKDKASKAAGLQSSIRTRTDAMQSQQQGTTKLGG